jgi:hypothetical protein
MFEPIEGLGDRVVAVRGVGTVTADDYRTVLAPAVERATAGGGHARLLLELGAGFQGYDPGAMLADTSLGITHLGSIERIAIVTDEGWIRRAISLFGALVPAEIRLFPTTDAAAARDWIRA